MLAGGLVRWIRRPQSPWARLRAVVSTLVVWALLLEGTWKLEQLTLTAFGGRDKLWLFEKLVQNRYTSMAMLTGTLRLAAVVGKVGPDDQIYNGAIYTNWGFGVPLLQMPFHALAPKIARIAQRFFPDRAICFFYLAVMIPILWAAFDRLFAMRERPGAIRLKRHVLSWTATGLVLITTLYPLMMTRFFVYEETLCYFVVFELLALAAYVFAMRSWGSAAICGMGATAGLGLLIRPTGIVYLGVWSVLLVLERRTWRAVLVFASSVAPFLAFWMYSNWVRSGSPAAFGLSNTLPYFGYHTPILRFGSVCSNTVHHAAEAAARLFSSFFVTVSTEPTPWMKKCHFDFEDRPPAPGTCDTHEPFFGAVVFLLLAWMLLHQLVRRERRFAAYVPFASIAAMFAAYALGLGGFVWRYAGDFWPLIVLAHVQYVRFLPVGITRPFGLRLALVFAGAGYATYTHDIEPRITLIETLDEQASKSMWDDFSNYRLAQDKPFSSRLKCADHPDQPYKNGEGWKKDCFVDTFTNVYIGVPYKSDDHYQLLFKTEGFETPTLRVYLNGRIYTARRSGDGYVVDVTIAYGRLSSPTVLATIEWTRDLEPVSGKLLSIQLT